ncbi:MAG: hypothetical protein HQK52_17150 [Oligoflexia bacterium]|nr:hypothetical protein [Oligoflexia bacterium]
MKSENFTLRLSVEERKELEKMAKRSDKTVSEYIRFLIFSKKESEIKLILEKLNSIQQNQQQQFDGLSDINLRTKKILRHGILLSSSIFQIRYVMTKIVSMLSHAYGNTLPKDFELPNNKGKEEFIKTESDKVALELEVIN